MINLTKEAKLILQARNLPFCPVCGGHKEASETGALVCWGECWRNQETGLKYTDLSTKEWLEKYALHLFTKWEKPYVGPFDKKEAEALAEGLKRTANPGENLIHTAQVRRRAGSINKYDVYIKVTK